MLATAPPVEVRAARTALFLDLDGTLADFEAAPTLVKPTPARSALLRRLDVLLQGRIAVISGRTIDDIDRITERTVANVAGVHGLQRRTARGALRLASPHPDLPHAVDIFASLARLHPGCLLEVKPLSVALHYRQAPMAGPKIREAAASYAEESGLMLQEGEMVIELLTPGKDKGRAVQEFMREEPFVGATPIFVGDDITDETAFAAVQALGGVGILVGNRKNTVATRRLSGVVDVMAWLAASLDKELFELRMLQ